MRSLRLLVPLLVAVGVVMAAPSASAEVECENVSDCTSVPGPWVAVPGLTQQMQYGATWVGQCATGAQPLGTDWSSTTPFAIDVYLEQGSGLLVYGQGNVAAFLAVNRTGKARSFQPLLGCSTAPAARAAGAPGPPRRISSHRLEAGDRAAFTHRCRRGERLVSSGSAVGFFEQSAPGAAELAGLRVRHTERGRAVQVAVRTGPKAGDDERVELQVSMHCRG